MGANKYLAALIAQKKKGEDFIHALKGHLPNYERLQKQILAWDKQTKYIADKAGLGEIFQEHHYYPAFNMHIGITDDEWYSTLSSGVQQALLDIDAMIDLLSGPLSADGTRGSTGPLKPAGSGQVFVVHGHDGEAREGVARFLESLGLDVVILHERPNSGKTIIEKLEAHANTSYAVVLLTADDVGKAGGEEKDLQPRARQNVVFEAGFFMGKLGRERVALLYEPGVELPSDLSGLVYIELDKGETWKARLFKELSALGFDVSPDAWLGSGNK